MRKLLITICAGLLSFAVLADGLQQRAAEAANSGKSRETEYQFEGYKKPEWHDQEGIKRLAEEGNRRALEAIRSLQEKKQASDQAPQQAVAGRLVVALSSSMPKAELQSYFRALNGQKEPVIVLRGFIGGGSEVKPTLKWIDEVRREGDKAYQVQTVVDPIIYSQLNIEAVPAVAWLNGVTELGHCDQEDFDAAVVVYGNTSLFDALSEARKQGAAIPEHYINRFNPDHKEAGNG